jgi:hypothetical protein
MKAKTEEIRAFPSVGRAASVTMFILLNVLTCNAGQKENTAQCSQVYTHTFDEVFQASQETIERDGNFVADLDKTKGTMKSKTASGSVVEEIVLTSGAKNGETSVNVTHHYLVYSTFMVHHTELQEKQGAAACSAFLGRVQKVLATYR